MKLYYFILNLKKDIEDFNGWNFEWKMETRRVEKLDLSLVIIILFYIEFGKEYTIWFFQKKNNMEE